MASSSSSVMGRLRSSISRVILMAASWSGVSDVSGVMGVIMPDIPSGVAPGVPPNGVAPGVAIPIPMAPGVADGPGVAMPEDPTGVSSHLDRRRPGVAPGAGVSSHLPGVGVSPSTAADGLGADTTAWSQLDAPAPSSPMVTSPLTGVSHLLCSTDASLMSHSDAPCVRDPTPLAFEALALGSSAAGWSHLRRFFSPSFLGGAGSAAAPDASPSTRLSSSLFFCCILRMSSPFSLSSCCSFITSV
mmetsp:Transcript_16976/g.40741  ORF Transcript_16976/g.40741 Transcript_16976/m.40741 type:complete len:245 (-) Transcript_16976:601-1335(-)